VIFKKILFFILGIVLVVGIWAYKQTGEPDKLGSWGQINQDISRPADWRQIVQDSEFKLGERRLAGTWEGKEEGPEDDEKYYEMDYGTYPCMDGSTVCVPMAVEFARQHLGLSDDDANGFVLFNTTGYAYESLIRKELSSSYIRSTETTVVDRPVDIILATEPSDEHLALAERMKVELITEPVCYDAFVFIVHKDNPVESLTVEQIQKIYTGAITNWKEVGGDNRKIHPFQREENSGSQTTMEKQVMRGKKMLEPDKIAIVAGMGELIKTVGEYENRLGSIGYTFKYYVDTLYRHDNIKVLKIEGVEPTNKNMQNRTYPFTTNYFGVIRAEDKENTGGRFLDWMLSEEGQRCIEQAGYCPMRSF